MTSSRLPGKVGLPLGHGTVLDHVITRAQQTEGVDAICLAIPEGHAHDPILAMADRHPGVGVCRGPEDDVLERTALAAATCQADRILRITSDCPLFDPEVGAEVLRLQEERGVAFASTALESGYPIGLDAEVFDRSALEMARKLATDPYEREHVTPWLWRRPETISAAYLDRQPDRRHWRLAVDTQEDLQVIRRIVDALGPDASPRFPEIERWLLRQPGFLETNQHIQQTPYQWQ